MIEQAIYSRLVADTDVNALVGTRIYPQLAPQKTAKPYLVYRRIDSEHPNSKSRGRTTDSARALIEIVSVAATYSGVKSLADKVRLSLQNFAGTVSVTGGGSVKVKGVLIEGESDDPEMPSDLTDEVRHLVGQDYAIWFNESSPT